MTHKGFTMSHRKKGPGTRTTTSCSWPRRRRASLAPTENICKVRWGNLMTSFEFIENGIKSSLAGHGWRLKDGNNTFTITWKAPDQ